MQVGILFKKGDTSTDTFLKAYGLDKESGDFKEQRRNGGGMKLNISSMMTKIACPHIEGFLREGSATVPAIIGRLELYVEEDRWKATDRDTKQALFSIICTIEKNLKKGILKHWNLKRNDMIDTKTCKVDQLVLNDS